ncbi:MAG: hypothetical protein A2V83_07170 [Nitrospirae bacterium RBG_16_64_22]|nr:MAG: hypothetical protein A2V83_07170 [Nitrospirae bacterium RBG_16_64_22]
MKKIALATVTALFILAAVAPQAWAGDHKVRHRWEGAAIALGGLILLDAILDPRPAHAAVVHAPVYAPAPVYVRDHRHYHHYRDGGWTCEFRSHRDARHHDHYRHHQHGHSGYGGR